MRESELVRDIIVGLYPALRLWRINTGSVVTRDGRRFSTGTPKGFPDLFGVLPASRSKAGHAVPVFVECKVHPNKPTPEQLAFIATQTENGAAAGVAYSVEEAWQIIKPALKEEENNGHPMD